MSIYSSACGYPIFLVPLTEETVFSLMSIFGPVVKSQVAAAVWVDFWALCSVTLVCTSLSVPIDVFVTLTSII